MTLLGELKVKVENEDSKCNFELLCSEKGGVPLFGHEWLKHIHLNWKEIKSMRLAQERGGHSVNDRQILSNSKQILN